MITFILAPAGPEVVVRADVRAMLEAGELIAYVVRDNERLRRMALVPLGSTDRDTAEWINEQIEDGRTVKAVAREIHVSAATIRRFLLSLELTEEVEAGEWHEEWASLHGFDFTPPADELSVEELSAVFNPGL